MTGKVKTATAYLVFALYVVILYSLLRPGGNGQLGVANWGLSLAGLAVS